MILSDAPRQALQVFDRHGCGLQIRWFRDGDRYGHEIVVVTDSAETVCLAAELGRGRDPWPASPPLQQCSLEGSVAGGPTALFLGMAGQSHWSQSVETDAATVGLTFDVACRVVSRPVWLGSTYGARCAIDALSPSKVRLTAAAGVELTLTALTAGIPGDSSSARAEVCGSQVAIVADSGKLRLPATVRWRYRVDLSAAPAARDDR